MKEEFFDEQILNLRNQKEKEAQKKQGDTAAEGSMEAAGAVDASQIPPEERSIYTGIRIDGGVWIYFERRFLQEEVISMMVPKNFTPMSPEAAKFKYPSEHRPQTILTDSSGSVNLLFQQMAGTVPDGIEAFRNLTFGMMKRINQGIKVMEQGMTEAAGKEIAYVEFSNPAMDGKLYNLMFFLEAEGSPYMGTFNCRTKGMKYWKKAAFEMLKSIEVVEKTKEV